MSKKNKKKSVKNNTKSTKATIIIFAICTLVIIEIIAGVIISKNIKANKIREAFNFTCKNFVYTIDKEVIYYDLTIIDKQNYEILEVYINDEKVSLDKLQPANFGYRIQLLEQEHKNKNKVNITLLDKVNNVKITKETETSLMYTI